MREETTNVPLLNEVAAAFVADGCRGDKRAAERLRSDCRTALNDLDVRVPDSVDVRVAENTPDTVHVPLPHYNHDEAAAMTMTEDELKQISGGEIIIAVCIGIGVTLTAVVVVGGLAIGGVLDRVAPIGSDSPSSSSATASVDTVGGNPELS